MTGRKDFLSSMKDHLTRLTPNEETGDPHLPPMDVMKNRVRSFLEFTEENFPDAKLLYAELLHCTERISIEDSYGTTSNKEKISYEFHPLFSMNNSTQKGVRITFSSLDRELYSYTDVKKLFSESQRFKNRKIFLSSLIRRGITLFKKMERFSLKGYFTQKNLKDEDYERVMPLQKIWF